MVTQPKGALLVGHANFFCNQTWQGQLVIFSLKLLLKKNFTALVMDGVQLSQGYRATTRRQFTFYHSVLRTTWYSFSQSWKDERLS